jgi:hypothetical protein
VLVEAFWIGCLCLFVLQSVQFHIQCQSLFSSDKPVSSLSFWVVSAGIFMILIYAKGLAWEYLAETLTILLAQV